MIHTSIRLSEEHANRIKETGKSPTAIIKESLDAYFKISSISEAGDNRSAHDIIEEHMRLYHKHNVPTSEHATNNLIEHSSEHAVSTSVNPEARPILEEIRRELEANREPMLSELADRFKVPAQTISKAISPYGIRAQETKRAGVAGRYFTLAMKGQIDDILTKV